MQLGVLGLQVRGHLAGVGGLIEGGILEGDREGAHRARPVLAHQGDQRAGVHAAGEERAERDVRGQAQADGVTEQLAQLLLDLPSVGRGGPPRAGDLGQRPVGGGPQTIGLPGADREQLPGAQLGDSLED